MMPNDTNAIRHLRGPMPVLKEESRRLPTRHEFDRSFDMPIVVPGQGDYGTALSEPSEQLARRRGGGRIVHQIAYDDELPPLVFVEQFRQPAFD